MTGLPPTLEGATQENCIEVVEIDVLVRLVGALGFVMITAPFPAAEKPEVPYTLVAATLA